MKDQRINQRERDDARNPKQSQNARYRDEDVENNASNLTKIGGPRTESAFDVRMPETTSAQEVPQRITASRREKPYRGKTRGQVRVKTRLRCRASQGKYKVVNYVDKKHLEWKSSRRWDESGRTGPEGWRDTPRILESSSSRTRVST